jgi:hypothetical protein
MAKDWYTFPQCTNWLQATEIVFFYLLNNIISSLYYIQGNHGRLSTVYNKGLHYCTHIMHLLNLLTNHIIHYMFQPSLVIIRSYKIVLWRLLCLFVCFFPPQSRMWSPITHSCFLHCYMSSPAMLFRPQVFYIRMWECYHVCLYVYTLHHHCAARGTRRALLEPVDGGPEKGRIVYGKFLGAARTATGEVRRPASG